MPIDKRISDAELDLMEVLWAADEPLTATEVSDAGGSQPVGEREEAGRLAVCVVEQQDLGHGAVPIRLGDLETPVRDTSWDPGRLEADQMPVATATTRAAPTRPTTRSTRGGR